jgi:hypothetical protein
MANIRKTLSAATNCPPNLSFATDIAKLFTPTDVAHMKSVTGGQLDLSSYASVKIWASKILQEVSGGDMPPPGSGEDPWTPAMVNTFACWIQQGCQP